MLMLYNNIKNIISVSIYLVFFLGFYKYPKQLISIPKSLLQSKINRCKVNKKTSVHSIYETLTLLKI